MKILCIRHCEDEELGDRERVVAERFRDWHPPGFREEDAAFGGLRDPCLSETGILVAGDGIPDETRRLALNAKGYGGIRGGLRRKALEFAPELVLVSPLARAVQTALVTFDRSDAPIIVHPGLREISTKGYAPTPQHPRGKPGVQGLGWPDLQHALYRHPRSSKAFADASLVPENWFDPCESWDNMRRGVDQFSSWLATRPERRIAVVSHGGCLKEWLKVELSHGQYVEGELNPASEKHLRPRVILNQFSSGVAMHVEQK